MVLIRGNKHSSGSKAFNGSFDLPQHGPVVGVTHGVVQFAAETRVAEALGGREQTGIVEVCAHRGLYECDVN